MTEFFIYSDCITLQFPFIPRLIVLLFVFVIFPATSIIRHYIYVNCINSQALSLPKNLTFFMVQIVNLKISQYLV